MTLPKTMEELVPAGYKMDNQTATCSYCGADIEWWITPRGSKMPLDPMNRGTDKVSCHFDTCTGR